MNRSTAAESSTLLEREHEVAGIVATLRGLERSEGGILALEGPAGIGKSRLLEIGRERAAGLGLCVLNAHGIQLEQGFPFGVVRQLFERVLSDANQDQRDQWLSGAAALAAEVLTDSPLLASPAPAPRTPSGDPSFAWQHGLYWLTSNLAAVDPVVLVVDDLQWCDTASARALVFIGQRLAGQPIALLLATRPLDPSVVPELAMLLADPSQVLRPSPLSQDAVSVMVADRLSEDPDDAFVRACLEATGGNPFLLGELLDEARAGGLAPTAAGASKVAAIVPRGVANAVLRRLARLSPCAAALGRALSVLGDDAQVTDGARLADLDAVDVEAAMSSLVAAGVIRPGSPIRFAHPLMRSAVYEDLSAAERERLHRAAAKTLSSRGAPSGQIAAHVMRTEPRGDPEAVQLLRQAAREAMALGDAGLAAGFLARALDEPPAEDERTGLVLDLGLARARAGAPGAIAPLSEIVRHAGDPAEIVTAAIELSGMLFFDGRAAEAAAILRRAQERLPPGAPERDQLDAAFLGASYTSASARREADATISALRDPGGPARNVLEATTLATLAMDELMHLRSASKASDFAHRALAAGLPLEPHRGEAWAVVALAVLATTDQLDAALRGTEEILARARERGAAVTVATILALRSFVWLRRGDLVTAQGDAYNAIDLAPALLGAEFVVLALATAVLSGLERDETPDSLRRLVVRSGVRYDTEFSPSTQLRYASGVLHAAAGNHEAAVEELCSCESEHPALGGENPAVIAWRSAAALSLAELGRLDEARDLAAEELRRAEAFGAPRAVGMALRAQALVGPHAERQATLERALEVLGPSQARLEHARVLVDLGATLRAGRQRAAAREPLLLALTLARRCGSLSLERRGRSELAAVGLRPRSAASSGADSLTPSERRVVELAAAGGTNREIAQTLFVTEKTVETHLARAFRKLDISSRRQLPDVLAGAVS